MILGVSKFPKVRYVHYKQVRWEIKQPFDGVFTQ